MSCDRRCSDPENDWFTHDDCSKCPGQDSGGNGGLPGNNGCGHCLTFHPLDEWPHEPEPDIEKMRVFIDGLIDLSKDLLGFADLTTKAPHHMTNGVMIVKKHIDIINDLDLTKDIGA